MPAYCIILHGRRREGRKDVEGLGKAAGTPKDVQAGLGGLKAHRRVKDGGGSHQEIKTAKAASLLCGLFKWD